MSQKKREPELDLIARFKVSIANHEEFGIEKEINFGRDNKLRADVEYKSQNKGYFVIEAKSHETSNAQNTRHQIFGQLMKEHGKASESRPQNFTLGMLIPGGYPPSEVNGAPKSDGVAYYRAGFTDIPRAMFLQFGKLVNAKHVFVCHTTGNVDIYSWKGFYDGANPMYAVVAKT